MKYEYWFANLKLSAKRKQEIRGVLKSAEELYYIEETALQKFVTNEKERKIILESTKKWDLDREYQTLIGKGISMVSVLEQNYPKRLKHIATPPYALYIKGNLPKEEVPTVAIVGARACSPYGEMMAREFSKTLAEAGMQVISGMARGVDSAAQIGAIDAQGNSYAVLGCGVDICYPKDAIGLYMELQEVGGVISEFPIGTPPLAQNFPARNRIISGLSDLVLVIEAKEKSGSLITADFALEQGKDVYALPGPINSSLSRGCNALIKQGAGILLSPQDLLDDLGILRKQIKENTEQNKIVLEREENIVYSCLGFHPINTEQLMKETGLPIMVLLDILMSLELKGFVREIATNYYVREK